MKDKGQAVNKKRAAKWTFFIVTDLLGVGIISSLLYLGYKGTMKHKAKKDE